MNPVVLGRVHGLFGVRGWVKVYSYTQPPANILDYPDWQLRVDGTWRPMRLADGRAQGKGLIAHLAPAGGEPLPDRDAAAALLGADIAVDRAALPPLADDEVYWVDLIGCAVTTTEGVELGRVTDMMDTGAHGIMVVTGDDEHLIPLVRGPIVQAIDLDARAITVDWQTGFL